MKLRLEEVAAAAASADDNNNVNCLFLTCWLNSKNTNYGVSKITNENDKTLIQLN
jgi:hypothetical protein